MNEIIKNIEAAQMKAEAPEFNVGDTVRVHGKIKEGNRERIQVFEGTVIKRQNGGRNRVEATVKHSQLEKILTELVLKKHGHYTPLT